MDVHQALGLLGVGASTPWEEVRRAYRDQLMASHPDAAGAQASPERTEQVVEAFRTLRELTDDGLKPLPTDSGFGFEDHDFNDPNAPLVLHARPGDVFVRLCQAGEHIGHVSYKDRDANILQITLDSSEHWGPSQLTAELTADGDLTLALFSLEPMGVRPAPPIGDVVADLAESLRRPAPIDS